MKPTSRKPTSRSLVCLLFLAPAMCSGQTSSGPLPANLVLTHATAHRRLPNTVADASVSIHAEAVAAATVTQALANRSTTLLAYLRREGAERLSTAQVSLEPRTHTVKGGPDEIVGYTGELTVRFRGTPDTISRLMGGSLSQGANTLEDVTFSPREEELTAARQELAIEAVRAANAQAEAVAKAVGEHVVELREISVDAGNNAPAESRAMPMMAMAKAAAPVKPIELAAGDQDVEVTVSLKAIIAR